MNAPLFTATIGTPRVIVASPEDHEGLASVLARAFDADPIVSWVFRDDEARDHARTLYFRTTLALYRRYDGILTVDSRLACALWLPPGKWRVSFWRELLLAPTILRMLGMRRLGRGLAAFDRLQREHPTEPHHYLALLGVDPSCQSQGLGTALLGAGLERADRDGLGAYLETSNSRNVALYERHGFEVKKTIDFGPGSPTCWLMARPPRVAR
jgi:ribosomal protein S18 acetylase RimI-like enzyme